MALTYVPRQNNQAQMFSLLTNLMMQKIGHKQRLEVADQRTKTATALFNAKTAQDKVALEAKNLREDKKEIRGFKKAGWREAESQKPVVNINDTGLVPPKGWEQKDITVDGKQYAVFTNGKGGIRLAGGPSKQGTRLTTPEGFELVSGYMGEQGGKITDPTTGFRTSLQKEIDSLSGQKQRLEEIGSLFKPEYQRWGTKGLMYWRGLKEKAQGLPGAPPVSDQDRKELSEFTTFRSTSKEQFAKVVHDLAGGTLTKHEAKTYGGFLANAEKNSETEYMANLQQNYSGLSKALARKNYYLNIQKMKPTQFHKLRNQNKLMTVAQFDSMIDKKGAEELTRLRQEKPNAPYEELKEEVLEILKASFYGF